MSNVFHCCKAALSPPQNESCDCSHIDTATVRLSLAGRLVDLAPTSGSPQVDPNLFSQSPIFLSKRHLVDMTALIETIEKITQTPEYFKLLTEGNEDLPLSNKGPKGLFMGYDFHINEKGPHLIEINTNAGGAFLLASAYDANSNCCNVGKTTVDTHYSQKFARQFVEMVHAEWQHQGLNRPLRSVAIVDEHPQEQYLNLEFELAQTILEQSGIKAIIADPTEFEMVEDMLAINGQIIDFVYNRLVDFDLSQPQNAVLRQAYENDSAVISPNPRHHFLRADKRNLHILSSQQDQNILNLSDEELHVLRLLPETVLLTPNNAEQLWADRKNWFFKPVAGHGSKAVYRGAKLTKKTWKYITSNTYVAQKVVQPDVTHAKIDGETASFKFDIRLFTYGGEVMMAGARLYRGQTTNFRTHGGGLAPVYLS